MCIIMSVFSVDTIKLYADSIGLTNLGDEVLTLLCHDTEYRVREIIQEASKFMRHSNRTKLTTEDINYALRLKHVEPIYGYDPSDSVAFKHFVQGDLYYATDREVDFDTILTSSLPKIPQPVRFTSHWLAIEGVQPQIPENPIQEDESAPLEQVYAPQETLQQQSGSSSSTANSNAKIPQIKHHLSKEHQMYFDTITKCLLVKDNTAHQTALKSLSSDAGIQQLVPYFVQFVAEMVMKHLRQLDILKLLVSTVNALLNNQYLFLEPYLHQIMPTLLTCIVGKRLCNDLESEDHWTLREESSHLVSLICKRFGDAYISLQPRIMKTLSKALIPGTSDEKTKIKEISIPSIYGALACLSMLGKDTVQLVVLPYFQYIYDIIHHSDNQFPDIFINKCHQALLFSIKELLSSRYEEIISKGTSSTYSPIALLEKDYPSIFNCIGSEKVSHLINSQSDMTTKDNTKQNIIDSSGNDRMNID